MILKQIGCVFKAKINLFLKQKTAYFKAKNT